MLGRIIFINMPVKRYGNRNDWKKVYSRSRRKPQTESLVDTVTNQVFTFDKNRTIRDRDYFVLNEKRQAIPLFGLFPVAEYDEGVISFFGNEANCQTTENFSFAFSGTPYIVLTVEPAGDDSHGINAYGVSYDANSLTVGVSSDFVGNVRYRAVYSANGYPAAATSPVSSSGFVVSAGTISVSDDDSYFASYPELDFFQEYRATTWDQQASSDNNVHLTVVDVNGEEVNGRISSNLTNDIHFIVAGAVNSILWPPS